MTTSSETEVEKEMDQWDKLPLKERQKHWRAQVIQGRVQVIESLMSALTGHLTALSPSEEEKRFNGHLTEILEFVHRKYDEALRNETGPEGG